MLHSNSELKPCERTVQVGKNDTLLWRADLWLSMNAEFVCFFSDIFVYIKPRLA